MTDKKNIALTGEQINNLIVWLNRVPINKDGNNDTTLREVIALHSVIAEINKANLGLSESETKKEIHRKCDPSQPSVSDNQG